MRTLHQQIVHDRKNGMTEAQIAEKHNLTTNQVRTVLTQAKKTMYRHAVPVTPESLDLIATNNNGIKPEIEGEETFFLLPEDPNEHAAIIGKNEFYDNYTFVEGGRPNEFRRIKHVDLAKRDLLVKCLYLIRHEQGLVSQDEAWGYWKDLSEEAKAELTRRAAESDFYKVKLTQLDTDNTTMVMVAAPLGTDYKDVVQQVREGKLKPF